MRVRTIKYILTIFFCFFIFNCSFKKEEKILKKSKILPLEIIYKEAYKNFENGNYQQSVEFFSKIESDYSYTPWAPKALLMKAYIYYDSSKYLEAIENLQKFKKIYSTSSYLSYAEYLISICLYEQINVPERDQSTTELVLLNFKNYIKKYPKTDYTEDIKLKLDLVYDVLANKEMIIARYYQKRGKWLAALKRLSNILENYQKTIFIEEALHRMVEINYKIGNISSAKKYASILGYNFNDSDWFKKSYIIVNNRDFVIQKSKIKKGLKDKLKALIN